MRTERDTRRCLEVREDLGNRLHGGVIRAEARLMQWREER